MQRFILLLGHPAYAVTAVLFTLLLFSGLGSRLVHKLPRQRMWLAGLAAAVMLGALVIFPWLVQAALGLPLWVRLAVTVFALAPLGFLMGTPLPAGVRALEPHAAGLIPWVWGVNGAASVVASVLAALLALSFGFRLVLVMGALCYAGAWLVLPRLTRPGQVPPRDR